MKSLTKQIEERNESLDTYTRGLLIQTLPRLIKKRAENMQVCCIFLGDILTCIDDFVVNFDRNIHCIWEHF